MAKYLSLAANRSLCMHLLLAFSLRCWGFLLHVWMTCRFRYFIFSDPCVLIFSAGWGLQPEYLDDEPKDGELVGKRIKEGMMVAFTPNPRYGSRRAETAISGYIFKGSTLFDDYFEGAGSFAA